MGDTLITPHPTPPLVFGLYLVFELYVVFEPFVVFELYVVFEMYLMFELYLVFKMCVVRNTFRTVRRTQCPSPAFSRICHTPKRHYIQLTASKQVLSCFYQEMRKNAWNNLRKVQCYSAENVNRSSFVRDRTLRDTKNTQGLYLLWCVVRRFGY